jgi:hypothetical protein
VAFAAGYLSAEIGEHELEEAWAIWLSTRLARQHATMIDSILRAVPQRGETSAGAILVFVHDDYGAVPARTVFRYIRVLVDMKFLVRHGPRNGSIYSRAPRGSVRR